MSVVPDPFTEHRPLLFSIAYRMLGSASLADDVLQEAWLRWDRADGIERPRAWLSTVVTRICLDELKSARAQREVYVGPWLPEPLLVEEYTATASRPELHESLSMAFLVLLERLNPKERAAFVLRELFEADYADVADVLETSQANARQLVRRARQHIDAERPRFDPDSEHRDLLVARFATAVVTGDLSGLQDVLAHDVQFWSDGGGKVAAAIRVVQGADRVAKLLIGLAGKDRRGDPQTEFVPINGQPGFVLRDGRAIYSTLSFDIVGGRITAVRSVRNPDKLGRL